MLLAFRAQDRVVFLFGFAKNERENVGDDELAKVRLIADYWLTADKAMVETALDQGLLIEVENED